MKLDRCLKGLGLSKCASKPVVYKRGIRTGAVALGVYVDDLIVTGENATEIANFKKQMTS